MVSFSGGLKPCWEPKSNWTFLSRALCSNSGVAASGLINGPGRAPSNSPLGPSRECRVQMELLDE